MIFLPDSILPRKRAELYTALGYNKHGKTEFYRDFSRHLATTPTASTTPGASRGW